MTVWQLRPARTEDATALAACIEAAYSAYAERISDLPPVAEGIADDIEKHLVVVAEVEHKIAGGMVLMVREDFVQLANIAVHPQYSGLGLGRGLLEHAEMQAKNLGIRELRLSTHVDIPENVELYTHLEWQETNRAGNKVHMKKRI